MASCCFRFWFQKKKGAEMIPWKVPISTVFLDTSRSLLGMPYVVVFLNAQIFILLFYLLMSAPLFITALFFLACGFILWLAVFVLLMKGFFLDSGSGNEKVANSSTSETRKPSNLQLSVAVFIKTLLVGLVMYECCIMFYSFDNDIDIMAFIVLGFANLCFWILAALQNHIIERLGKLRKMTINKYGEREIQISHLSLRHKPMTEFKT